MVGLLGLLTERQQQADTMLDHPGSTVQLRVQQARTMLALMQINRASLKGGLLESCRRAVIALASDGSYGARREAAWLAPVLLQRCDKPEVCASEEIVFGWSAATWHRRCMCLAVPQLTAPRFTLEEKAMLNPEGFLLLPAGCLCGLHQSDGSGKLG